MKKMQTFLEYCQAAILLASESFHEKLNYLSLSVNWLIASSSVLLAKDSFSLPPLLPPLEPNLKPFSI